MANSKPIFWHQGMFLQPQHFQLSEQYLQSQLSPLKQFLQPHFWGVASIELIGSALSNKTCELQSGSFVFPDGTYVSVPDNAVISPRTFDDEAVEPDKPFNIYIGLAKTSEHQDNVTSVNDLSSLNSVKSRYVSLNNPEEVNDSYQAGPKAQVRSLLHVLRFVFENEIDTLDNYVLIPVAQVVREGDAIQYDKDFVAPSISLGSSDELVKIVKEVRDEITGRAYQLESANTRAAASAEFDPNTFRYRLGLQCLSRYIPRFHHITETSDLHPWHAYGALRELIGEVSTFTRGVNMLGETAEGEKLLPGYDHHALRECFQSARSLVTQLLNEITIGPQFLVDMAFDGTYYSCDIPAEFFSQQVDFYLILNTQKDFGEFSNSLFTAAKLASRDTVGVLAERALPGIGLTHVEGAPSGLPSQAFTHYVKVDIQDEQWAKVSRHQNAALFWDEAPEDLAVELVIVRK